MFKAGSFALPFFGSLSRSGRRTPGLLVGVQFADDRMAVARVRVTARGQPIVEHLQRLPAAPGQRDEAVRRLLHTGQLRQARVVVVLAPGQYDTYQVASPNVPDEEMREAVRWQLRGVLPYSPDAAAVDFVRLPQTGEAASHRPALLVFAAQRDAVAQVVAPFEAARVDIAAVDVPEMAQRNLAELNPQQGGTTAWLSFEAEAALLTVHLEGDLCFARRITLPAGGADLNDPHAAERLCMHVNRSIDLFERQSTLPPVSRLTIGPHRHADVLEQSMLEHVEAEVARFSPAEAFALGAGLTEASLSLSEECAAALGGALRVAADGAGRLAPAAALSELAQRFRRKRQQPAQVFTAGVPGHALPDNQPATSGALQGSR